MPNKNSILQRKIKKIFFYSKQIISKILTYTESGLFEASELIKRKATKIKEGILSEVNTFQNLESHEKLYRIGFLITFCFMFVTLFLSPPLLALKNNETNEFIVSVNDSFSIYSIFQTIFICSISIVFSLGYSKEIFKKLQQLMNRKIAFNIAISAILFTIYILSEFLTSHFINDFTKIDASNFDFGKIVLKLIFVPYAWVIFALMFFIKDIITIMLQGTVYFIQLIFLSIIKTIILFKWRRLEAVIKNIKFKIDQIAIKFFIVSITITSVVTVFSEITFKNPILNDITRQLFISSEYFPNYHCKNLKGKNILISDIGGGAFSVYNKQSKEFKISQCELNYSK